MKTLRPLLFFVSLLLVVGLACRFGDGGETPEPPPTEVSIQDEPTLPPEPTEPPVTEAPVPTEAPVTEPPAPEAQQFFTEEFDSPLSGDWTPLTYYDDTESDIDKVTVEAEDGRLIWDFDSKWVYYYMFYGAYEYEDVQLDVRADNRGKNNNNVSLICRYDPDTGWYEFNIANNGLYDILYAEIVNENELPRYNRIANGGSNKIKAGLEVNEYSIKCVGNELSLDINGSDVISIRDKKFGLRRGQVGVSVSSFDVLPILIEMDWIKISEP